MPAVIEWAKLRGWLVYHTRDSKRSEPGFPDLVMVRRPRLLLAELKSEGGALSEAQAIWITELLAVAEVGKGVEVEVWRPAQWLDGTIERALR